MKWQNDLVKDIRYNDYRDDLDWNGGEFLEVPTRPVDVRHPDTNQSQTMSVCNIENLKNQFNKIKNQCKCILEIGVDCNGIPTEMTATTTFLRHKRDDTFYFGIDLNDKSYLDNPEKNIYTIRQDSSNIDAVMDFIRSKGIAQIDFLFIDGWHSINQVMREWEYTNWLSSQGIVGFHDTSIHPGPNLFVKHLDKTKWDVLENVCSDYKNDWGIGFARKRLTGFANRK